MIVLVGGTKGGTSKSTLTTNIAAYLAGEGVDFIMVDADDPRQASSAKWHKRREANESGLKRIQCVQMTGNIHQSVLDISERYDHVLIDAGGRDSKELRTAMAAADLLLIPLQASQFDLESMVSIWEMIDQVRETLNPDLRAVAVLSKAPNNPMNTELAEARQLLEEFPGIELSSEIIRDRVVYREAIRDGRGVIEMNNSTAKAEIQLLGQSLFNLQ
jgi:chromosome partitioning protein